MLLCGHQKYHCVKHVVVNSLEKYHFYNCVLSSSQKSIMFYHCFKTVSQKSIIFCRFPRKPIHTSTHTCTSIDSVNLFRRYVDVHNIYIYAARLSWNSQLFQHPLLTFNLQGHHGMIHEHFCHTFVDSSFPSACNLPGYHGDLRDHLYIYWNNLAGGWLIPLGWACSLQGYHGMIHAATWLVAR